MLIVYTILLVLSFLPYSNFSRAYQNTRSDYRKTLARINARNYPDWPAQSAMKVYKSDQDRSLILILELGIVGAVAVIYVGLQLCGLAYILVAVST